MVSTHMAVAPPIPALHLLSQLGRESHSLKAELQNPGCIPFVQKEPAPSGVRAGTDYGGILPASAPSLLPALLPKAGFLFVQVRTQGDVFWQRTRESWPLGSSWAPQSYKGDFVGLCLPGCLHRGCGPETAKSRTQPRSQAAEEGGPSERPGILCPLSAQGF